MATYINLKRDTSIVRRHRRKAVTLALAGLCCFGTSPLLADELIGDTTTETYNNIDSIHNVDGNLILGNQEFGNGTYTITGDTAQTNVNFVPGGNGDGNPNGALIVGNGGTGNFTQGTDLTDNNNQVNVAGDLTLGQQPASVGTYTLNSGALNVGGQVAIGGQSYTSNTFTQNGGTLNLTNTASGNPDYVNVGGPGFNAWVGALAVGGGIGNGDGSNSGGNGTYNLNAGVINTYNLLLGPTGTGYMTQAGGQVTTSFFTAGFNNGSTGTYNLQGDSTSTLDAYSETIGYAGTGTFNQSGGVHTVTATLAVGQNVLGNPQGFGTYNMTGGTLTTGDTLVGDGEGGDFFISDADDAATHTVNGNLIMGGQVGGSGSYTITGTAQTNVVFVPGGNGDGNPNGALILGDYGYGTFTQGFADGSDSPTVYVAGDLILGHQGLAGNPDPAEQDSVGQYTMNSGDLTVDGKIVVGGASTATQNFGGIGVIYPGASMNVFFQNGGIVDITGSARGNSDYVGVGDSDHAGELFIGGGAGPNNDGGKGAYVMTGGELHAGVIEVGHTGQGYMTQSGGDVYSDIWLGNASGSYGYYELSSNGKIHANNEWIGLNGDGYFNQTGGENNVEGLLDIAPLSGEGTYALSGGSLNAGRIIVGDGTADNAGWGLFFGAGGTLNISGDAVLTTGAMRVGVLNRGTVNQSGGIVNATSLTLGEIGTVPNGNGAYNLTGNGQLIVSGDETLGVFGYGEVTQGTIGDAGLTYNDVTGSLILGAGDNINPNAGWLPRAGLYTLNSGNLFTNNTIVGSLGEGIFTQNGGTHSTNRLVIGDQAIPFDYTACGGACVAGGPSIGAYYMNDGTLNAGDMVVGRAGTGIFTQNGGEVNVDTAFTMYIGQEEGSTGTYTLTDGTLNVTTAEEKIGGSGTGYFLQSGGIHNFSGAMYLGDEATGLGEYDLTGGALTSGIIVLGEWGGTGRFFQNDTNGPSSVTTGNLVLARQGGSTGTYALGGVNSTLLVNGDESVGGLGTGIFTQSGGVNTVTGNTYVGHDGTGTFHQTGGTHSTTALVVGTNAPGVGTYNLGDTGSLTTNRTYVGGYGTGTFNQTGGTHTVSGTGHTNSGNVIIATYAGSKGTYNLRGGTLNATNVINNDTFNYSGGNLNANIINNGVTTLSGAGTRTVNGSVTNSGTFKVTNTTAVYTGTFTNHGAYISDPSDNYFVDLVVGATGYFTGGAGDRFFISGNFENNSQQNLLWDTDEASLFLNGQAQNLFLAGADLGALYSGYGNNFAWGEFSLDAGVSVHLLDGNGDPNAALYVGLFELGGGLDQLANIFSDYNIYYDPLLAGNAYLHDMQYALNGGGFLKPISSVPVPGTLGLLGAGLAGLMGMARCNRRT